MIIIFIFLSSISILGWKIYKLQNMVNDLKDNMTKFQHIERVKREVGWDSIWKIVNKNT